MDARFRTENLGFFNVLAESWKIFSIRDVFDPINFEILGGSLTFDWWGLLILFVLTVVAEIAIAYQVESIVKGKPARIEDTLGYVIDRLPKALLIYAGLVIILGGTWELISILIAINPLLSQPGLPLPSTQKGLGR